MSFLCWSSCSFKSLKSFVFPFTQCSWLNLQTWFLLSCFSSKKKKNKTNLSRKGRKWQAELYSSCFVSVNLVSVRLKGQWQQSDCTDSNEIDNSMAKETARIITTFARWKALDCHSQAISSPREKTHGVTLTQHVWRHNEMKVHLKACLLFSLKEVFIETFSPSSSRNESWEVW